MFYSANKSSDPTNKGKRPFQDVDKNGDVESPHDSTHSSDILVSAADKQDLIVSVRELVEANGSRKMQLLISNLRPGTALGKAQGDHVTAYQCLLEMLMIAVGERPLRLCAEIIAETAKSILPDKSMLFDNVLATQLAQVESVFTPKERHELVGPKEQQDAKKVRLDNSLKMARRAVFKQIVEQIGETFIREVNLDDHTAFARVGAMDRTQGPRVKKAIHCLKAINDLIYLNVILLDTTESAANKEHLLEGFYKNYLQRDARYKDGANEVFGATQISHLDEQWKLSSFDITAFLRTFQRRFMESENFPETIGNYFGDLFDFKYGVHKDEEYAADILFEVTAKHIVVMFRAFPCLQFSEDAIKENIIDEFLTDCVLKEQGWSQFSILRKEEEPTPMSIALVKAEVLKLVNFTECRLLSTNEKYGRDTPLPGSSSIALPKLK